MKKLITLILAVFMIVSLVAGCAQDGTDTPVVSNTPTQKPAESQQPSETDEPDDNDGAFKLPIVEEPVTFEMFAMVFMAQNMVDLNDGYAFQELANRTNVNFKWQIPSMASGGEQFNLLLASTDYPDAIQVFGPQLWVGGLDANVDNEFILDITDALQQYAPNYTAKRTATPELARDTTTDMGRVVTLRPIYKTRQPTYEGPVIRQDLLDKAGYTGELITVDDWYNALTALKGVVEKEPLYLANRDYVGLEQSLTAAHDVSIGPGSAGFIQVNGNVQYSMISDGMKDYLAMASKWYSEGLIDKDFASRTNNMRGDYTDILGNNHALFQSVFTYIDSYEAQALESGYELTPVRLPVLQKGNIRHVFTQGPKIGGGITTIFPTVSNLEVLLKCFDYLYTEEGALLYNYGVEGQGFNYVDGKPVLSELVVANPDGIGMSQALSLYCFPAPFPGAYAWEREFTDLMSEKSIDANFLWSEDSDHAYEISDSVTMTSDEAQTYSSLFSDINTYVKEQIPRFVIGELTIAEDWDGFVEQIKTMGIDECTGYWQAAVGRYNER